METRRDVIVRTAVLADQLGYEIFALPEAWGLDSTPVLTEIALRTARIRLASAVLSVWGRSPATLAMTAATLHQVCGGRYLLGLGASTKALAEGFHDTAFEHPAAKLRDVVTKVRALLAGQPAQLAHVPAARPLRLGQPPAPEIPIWVAALGRHTTRVAAELGDGWIPALVARDRLPAWSARLRKQREAAAPDARPLAVAAGPITVADDADADAARDIAASPRANPALGARSRHRHDPPAARHALAQHRGDPPGRSAKRPARAQRLIHCAPAALTLGVAFGAALDEVPPLKSCALRDREARVTGKGDVPCGARAAEVGGAPPCLVELRMPAVPAEPWLTTQLQPRSV
jgi:alkanesulfonate monooxygenase SsuD/methylene tetrahydromethanopterin reductase-like flavin-dependent oxidoreductase (luciferase family)